MRLSEFDYFLPKELIAQHPLPVRSQSRLMLLEKESGRISHHYFEELPDLLAPTDLLVLNNTKVFAARLEGTLGHSQKKIEVLLLKELEPCLWEALIKPARKVPSGASIWFGRDKLAAELVEKKDYGKCTIRFQYNGAFESVLDVIGKPPLPPYIRRLNYSDTFSDRDRYQTIYAKIRGSVAAPTAGLHFTTQILDALVVNGVDVCYVTLHVGYGTFSPVRVEDIETHSMEAEEYEVTPEAEKLINRHVARGGRIIAVGTTSTRTLEQMAALFDGQVAASRGTTNLFIYPGYQFKMVSGLLTNFHLPRSTLLMLVCAFAGKELVLECYREAVKEKYRFYSYGDCMLIV